MTNGGGSVVERYAYSAYGTPTITDGAGAVQTVSSEGNRYLYTGREWDEGLSLYHYRARMYDSEGGRFCSRDPIGFEGSKWLLHEFLDGNPTNRLDPDGKDWGFVDEYDWNPWDDDPIEDVDWGDTVLRNGTKVGHGMVVVGVGGIIILRGGAALSRFPACRFINRNRYIRLGPGRMGSGPKIPRLSIGPNRPNLPQWWKDLKHFDLRFWKW